MNAKEFSAACFSTQCRSAAWQDVQCPMDFLEGFSCAFKNVRCEDVTAEDWIKLLNRMDEEGGKQ